MTEYSEGDVTKLRAEIDEIDMALLQLIARRKDVAVEVAQVKQQIGSQDDEARMVTILDAVEKKATEVGLNGKEMRTIWKDLIAYMIKEQMAKYPY